MTEQIPAGYWQDSQGRLIPFSAIKPIDKARDELVREIVARAKAMSGQLAEFKTGVMTDIAAFVQLSAEEYGAKIGGKKGNVSLLSFDGRYMVKRAIAESLHFDERLQAAKALIDACLTSWTQGARPEIHVLINDAFKVDKEGNISTGRVLGLRKLSIDDERWQEAMQAIGDAVQVVDSKSYVRVYERIGDAEGWTAIPLDVAGAGS
ncbi:MAG: DUF3164 family protein [Zoogloeaceae bacterium]|jgi:hypothetical protein|nr:DUF3164 family protein [Zoogloeaceae bacterium]